MHNVKKTYKMFQKPKAKNFTSKKIFFFSEKDLKSVNLTFSRPLQFFALGKNARSRPPFLGPFNAIIQHV